MSSNIAQNKKAFFDYHLFDKFEAGIELKGPEVKSIRDRIVSLKESFARVEKDGIYIHGMHISPYEKSGRFTPDPIRPRRLLLHKAEIAKIKALTREKGYTLVATRIYFKEGFAKIEIAVAKGKKLFDKREKMRHKSVEREIRRSLKSPK